MKKKILICVLTMLIVSLMASTALATTYINGQSVPTEWNQPATDALYYNIYMHAAITNKGSYHMNNGQKVFVPFNAKLIDESGAAKSGTVTVPVGGSGNAYSDYTGDFRLRIKNTYSTTYPLICWCKVNNVYN